MIECPICHVINEEQAHFCSECGQRFNVQTQSPQPSFPTLPEPNFPNFQGGDSYKPQQEAPTQNDPVQHQQSDPAPQFQQPPFQHQVEQPPAVQPQPSNFPTTASFPEPGQNFPPQTNPGAPPQQAGSNPNYMYSNIALQNNAGGVAPPQNFGGKAAPQNFADGPPQNFVNNAPSQIFPDTSPSFGAPPAGGNSAQQNQPEPAGPRPKLHSPMLGGGDPEEDDLRGRVSKPRGLRSPLLRGDDEDDQPPVQQKGKSGLRSPLLRQDEEDDAPAPRKGGLRSPLLRGEDDPDPPKGKGGLRSPLLRGDDDDSQRAKGAKFPLRRSDDLDEPVSPKGKGGLRSPLLSGDDEDLSQSQKFSRAKNQNKSGSHLRSPLLGGSDDYEGDDDDPPPSSSKSTFPHVRRTQKDVDHDPVDPQSQSGRMPKGGLRSPLLGGAGEEDEEESHNPRSSGRFQTPGRKLHSPIFDGAGGGQTSDYENDEPYYEEINDPNILRSPLLASKLPMADRGESQASRARADASRSQMQPQPAPPPPQTPQPQGRGQTQAPDDSQFRERGFPDPQQPGPDMWRERGFQQSQSQSNQVAPSAPPPQPQQQRAPEPLREPMREPMKYDDSLPPPPPTARKSSRSTLLPTTHDSYDDEQPLSLSRQSGPVQASTPNMVILVPAFMAAVAKIWYMMFMSQALLLPANRPFAADQLMQLVLMIALIIFAATRGKR